MGYYEGNISDLGCNNNNGAFGNNVDWIWAFLLFALIGNNGWGGVGYGGGRGGIGENYVLATDFATIERKIDGVNNGLCDGFYAQNTNMLNGFAGVQQTLCQGFNGVNATVTNGFAGVNNAICTLGYQNQAGFNALSRELADCCCSTKQMLGEIRYDNAKNTCDIIRAGQDNTRAILDYLTNEKISSLQAENSGLKAQISNDRQSAYIVSQLKEPCPVPAYITPNPNCCYNYGVYPIGNNCGCASVQ